MAVAPVEVGDAGVASGSIFSKHRLSAVHIPREIQAFSVADRGHDKRSLPVRSAASGWHMRWPRNQPVESRRIKKVACASARTNLHVPVTPALPWDGTNTPPPTRRTEPPPAHAAIMRRHRGAHAPCASHPTTGVRSHQGALAPMALSALPNRGGPRPWAVPPGTRSTPAPPPTSPCF